MEGWTNFSLGWTSRVTCCQHAEGTGPMFRCQSGSPCSVEEKIHQASNHPKTFQATQKMFCNKWNGIAERQGFQTALECKLPTEFGALKPNLIMLKDNKAFVLDVTVAWEGGRPLNLINKGNVGKCIP
ncbi:hypothetical protein T4B_15211 [Trichinella pseudospiralis]|uniref:Uncharacterized protein n=1 Tax=Trichinella pseudospiralis TaxID=6337 RepID=A0A0V1IY34_TRIPS|nr:hypothetical protein T4B_15211 [Trichinella pseudospiralis]